MATDKNKRLSDRQQAIVKDYWKKSVDNNASQADVAKDWGISRKTVSLYVNSHHGKTIIAELQRELSLKSMPTFYAVLDEGVASGKIKFLELYSKIHGLQKPEKKEVTTKNETNHNIIKEGLDADDIKSLESLLEEPNIKRVK